MKSVVFNGRFLSRRMTGVDRFAYEVILAIDKLVGERNPVVAGLQFQIILPEKCDAVHLFKHLPVLRVGNHSGQTWEQWDLARAARGAFLVNLCNTAPFFVGKQLIVIHDAATVRVPHSYGRLFRLWYGALIPKLYRTSASVCTVSKFSKSDLALVYGPREDVRVLTEGTEHITRIASDASVLVRHQLNGKPYVLAVSSLSPHKNFAAIVRAVELIGNADFEVVIAGGLNPKVFSQSRGGLPNFVRYLGYVTDVELKALYENASCFIFPSIYEGYGLPPTEAMACGCPVLSSSAASLPEVCGDAALYFDPTSPSDLCEKLKMVMSDSSLRKSLKDKGLARASNMTWATTAKDILLEINRLAAIDE